MKWESSGALDYRLVADDGEILDHVHHRSGDYEVASTRKRYINSALAKAAAERRQRNGPDAPFTLSTPVDSPLHGNAGVSIPPSDTKR